MSASLLGEKVELSESLLSGVSTRLSHKLIVSMTV